MANIFLIKKKISSFHDKFIKVSGDKSLSIRWVLLASLAKGKSRSINLLIASQPTRGVDVGSIEYIHNQIVFARNKGIGVILNSTELEEIIALSDRIIVLFEGKVIAEFPSDTDPNIIGLAMAGEN